MFNNDGDKESFKIKKEELDIKDEIIECPTEKDNENVIGIIKKEMERKDDSQNELKIYKCKKCNFSSLYKNNLNLHVICKHTPNEQVKEQVKYYHCEECDFKSTLPSTLINHQKIHLRQFFPCANCKFQGKSNESLERHINRCHLKPVDIYNCKLCPFSTPKMKNLKVHVTREHYTPESPLLKDGNLRIFKCPKCSYSATRKKYLRVHIERKHTPDEEKKYFYCGHCDYRALVKRAIAIHIIRVHTHPDLIEWHKCPHCPSTHKLKYQLNYHIKHKHVECSGKNDNTLP